MFMDMECFSLCDVPMVKAGRAVPQIVTAVTQIVTLCRKLSLVHYGTRNDFRYLHAGTPIAW